MQCSLKFMYTYKTVTMHYLKDRVSTQSSESVACTDPVLLVICVKFGQFKGSGVLE